MKFKIKHLILLLNFLFPLKSAAFDSTRDSHAAVPCHLVDWNDGEPTNTTHTSSALVKSAFDNLNKDFVYDLLREKRKVHDEISLFVDKVVLSLQHPTQSTNLTTHEILLLRRKKIISKNEKSNLSPIELIMGAFQLSNDEAFDQLLNNSSTSDRWKACFTASFKTDCQPNFERNLLISLKKLKPFFLIFDVIASTLEDMSKALTLVSDSIDHNQRCSSYFSKLSVCTHSCEQKSEGNDADKSKSQLSVVNQHQSNGDRKTRDQKFDQLNGDRKTRDHKFDHSDTAREENLDKSHSIEKTISTDFRHSNLKESSSVTDLNTKDELSRIKDDIRSENTKNNEIKFHDIRDEIADKINNSNSLVLCHSLDNHLLPLCQFSCTSAVQACVKPAVDVLLSKFEMLAERVKEFSLIIHWMIEDGKSEGVLPVRSALEKVWQEGYVESLKCMVQNSELCSAPTESQQNAKLPVFPDQEFNLPLPHYIRFLSSQMTLFTSFLKAPSKSICSSSVASDKCHEEIMELAEFQSDYKNGNLNLDKALHKMVDNVDYNIKLLRQQKIWEMQSDEAALDTLIDSEQSGDADLGSGSGSGTSDEDDNNFKVVTFKSPKNDFVVKSDGNQSSTIRNQTSTPKFLHHSSTSKTHPWIHKSSKPPDYSKDRNSLQDPEKFPTGPRVVISDNLVSSGERIRYKPVLLPVLILFLVCL